MHVVNVMFYCDRNNSFISTYFNNQSVLLVQLHSPDVYPLVLILLVCDVIFGLFHLVMELDHH